MEKDAGAICMYGISSRARALCAVQGHKESLRFAIGTCSLREENEVHVVDVIKSEQSKDEVKLVGTYSHRQEIWSLSPSPSDSSLIFTCHSSPSVKENAVASLCKFGVSFKMESLLSLDTVPAVRKVLWDPSEISRNSVLSIHEGGLYLWDIETSKGGKATQVKTCDFGLKRGNGGGWNPHFPEEVVSLNQKELHFWDLRTLKESNSSNAAHSQCVRDIDFNANKPYHFTTAGDDSQIKFWDSRRLQDPIKQIQAHAHWVWNVKYHTNLDQLLISSGSDGVVKLWNMQSISSATSSLPQAPTAPRADALKTDSGLVKTYATHDDSVYGLAWGSAMDIDTWTFASLSYDGRAVFHQVPQDEKYKILLCDAGEGEDALSDDD